MPASVTIGVFVLAGVLLLVALIGGRFKLFGAEVSGEAGKTGRILAGVLGLGLLAVALLGSKPAPAEAESNATDNAASRGSNVRPEKRTPAGYPTQVAQAFMASCTSAGSSATQCQCVLQKFEERYTTEQFAVIDTQLRMGNPPPDFADVTASFKVACLGP